MIKLSTWRNIGFSNIACVGARYVKAKAGCYARSSPIGVSYAEPLFQSQATLHLPGSYNLFSHRSIRCEAPPEWFQDPLSEDRINDTSNHWSRTPEFANDVEDIKLIWDPSRFDWLPQWAWDARQGDKDAVNRLESWVSDWIQHNPANQGPNWRCGQEVSIRAMNMLLAGHILHVLGAPQPGFLRFLAEHARRIPPTISYAVAQDNNHATSESAALFLLGSYLKRHDVAEATRWQSRGRQLLERCVQRLIADDGTFSQYSVAYHRLMLDTLSFAELMRREFQERTFTTAFYDRADRATRWLWHMLDPSGRVPNLGHNDGSCLFNLDRQNYTNYVPSINLAAAVFLGQRVPRTPPSAMMKQFALAPTDDLDAPTTRLFPQGGYARLAPTRDTWGVLRFANFRFRPTHADALHLDVWHRGTNLLRDGGSHTYGSEQIHYHFTGTETHNTVQFDGRDQMPRISRFLFGSWLKMTDVSDVTTDGTRLMWHGSYQDDRKASHRRSVVATANEWQVEDSVAGFQDRAVVRWRLAPGNWQMSDATLTGKLARLRFESEVPLEIKLTTGDESLHYMEVSSIPVVEIVLRKPGTVRTTIELS